MMARRTIVPELLDTVSWDQAERNLADIRRINRFFGGYSLARRMVAPFATAGPFRVLDVGAASGDHARQLQRAFPGAHVTCLDFQLRNLGAAPFPKVAADAFHLPFADHSFDVVTAHLFLHHFSDAQVVQLLTGFRRVARRAVVITDLERHWLAHKFLPATAWLFHWHPVTLHDGPVSVAAAFRPAELLALATRAGWQTPRLRRHHPWFRLSLVETITE